MPNSSGHRYAGLRISKYFTVDNQLAATNNSNHIFDVQYTVEGKAAPYEQGS